MWSARRVLARRAEKPFQSAAHRLILTQPSTFMTSAKLLLKK